MPNELSVPQTSANMTAPLASTSHTQRSTPRSSDVPQSAETEQKESTVSRFQKAPVDDSNQPDVDLEQLDTALSNLNAIINERYTFQINQETNLLFVQVKDQAGEVVRQVPPAVVIEVASKIGKMVGLFLDENA